LAPLVAEPRAAAEFPPLLGRPFEGG